jgi:hypothetical protein
MLLKAKTMARRAISYSESANNNQYKNSFREPGISAFNVEVDWGIYTLTKVEMLPASPFLSN